MKVVLTRFVACEENISKVSCLNQMNNLVLVVSMDVTKSSTIPILPVLMNNHSNGIEEFIMYEPRRVSFSLLGL